MAIGNRSRRPLVLLLLAGVGCDDASAPEAPSTGAYYLESVDDCAPGPEAAECQPRPSYAVSGEMVLLEDGTATRTIRYALPGDPTVGTVSARGSYYRSAAMVSFALVEDGAPIGSVWRVRGSLSEGRLTLRYPHPADGEIVEVFARR
jgi:hypothetical protein